MDNSPYSFSISLPNGKPTNYTKHIQRYLTDMKNQYSDSVSYDGILRQGDPLLYEVFELSRPEVPGELIHGISILLPGKVGNEYFMTKGHFHVVLDTAEIYYCLHGEGYMVMENPQGDTCVERLRTGVVLYVPPQWAHRSVNTSSTQNLVTFFAYPGNAGHDYGTIETKGFRKLVIEQENQPVIVDNPLWFAE